MTQKIDYDLFCQQMNAEVLDSWQESTLLRLPIHDDPGHAALWFGPSIVNGLEATYMLTTICPSSGTVYATRVPPNLTSAREAASWIDLEIDTEHSDVGRIVHIRREYQPERTKLPDGDYHDVHCCFD
jgi:hypothetical protein